MRYLLSALIIGAGTIARAEEVASRIDAVTVYNDRAVIRRVAAVNLARRAACRGGAQAAGRSGLNELTDRRSAAERDRYSLADLEVQSGWASVHRPTPGSL